MGKTAGMVEINREYAPLALDLPGIPVGSRDIRLRRNQWCGDCKPGLPSGDEAAREKIPVSTNSEGFGTSFWNYPYRGKIQPYRRAGSKEPIHILPGKKIWTKNINFS